MITFWIRAERKALSKGRLEKLREALLPIAAARPGITGFPGKIPGPDSFGPGLNFNPIKHL
jgi:hypothetical protein